MNYDLFHLIQAICSDKPWSRTYCPIGRPYSIGQIHKPRSTAGNYMVEHLASITLIYSTILHSLGVIIYIVFFKPLLPYNLIFKFGFFTGNKKYNFLEKINGDFIVWCTVIFFRTLLYIYFWPWFWTVNTLFYINIKAIAATELCGFDNCWREIQR